MKKTIVLAEILSQEKLAPEVNKIELLKLEKIENDGNVSVSQKFEDFLAKI